MGTTDIMGHLNALKLNLLVKEYVNVHTVFTKTIIQRQADPILFIYFDLLFYTFRNTCFL